MGFLWCWPGAALLHCIVMSSPLMFSCSRSSQLCQFYFSLLPVFNHGVVAFSICLVLLCFFFPSSCWIYVYSASFILCVCARMCTSFLTMQHLFLLFLWPNYYCGCESNDNNYSPNWNLNHYTFSGKLWIKVSGFKSDLAKSKSTTTVFFL